MAYRMNIGNELAQAKYCETLEELNKFCQDHNFHMERGSFYPNNFPTVEGIYIDQDVEVFFRVQSRY